jgi:hypothetical protein
MITTDRREGRAPSISMIATIDNQHGRHGDDDIDIGRGSRKPEAGGTLARRQTLRGRATSQPNAEIVRHVSPSYSFRESEGRAPFLLHAMPLPCDAAALRFSAVFVTFFRLRGEHVLLRSRRGI